METLKLKKDKVKQLLVDIMEVEKEQSVFFTGKSILDFFDLKIHDGGFKITFNKQLPKFILRRIDLVFKNQTS